MSHSRLPNQLIVEGLMTTLDANDCVNIAPMGPTVDLDFETLIFRPFATSTTCRNLKTTGQGVFHVTDDVLLLTHAAIGRVQVNADIPTKPASQIKGMVLTQCCRYYELTVQRIDDHSQRPTFYCKVKTCERLRDFIGFNRAKHAVLEGAILATRLHLTGSTQVKQSLKLLRVLVDKTGTSVELQAFDEIETYVNHWQK